ncbi:GspE/PulE family protein [Brumicola nitratireducens]|uniref:Type II secretion system protein E n=1 Tax=Glaciecola nitratireducens (strain JCM 12485 / KCTC 12276 / FR1064) TaxID=1085623 RepID=G4QFE8_GLANF|nr:ATPase, T2SS/T4P/T4SS family [Glaciecola nitratireducens]AEP28492.1 type II secretion system protein E [Glaciecola nitratireducens FR1064]
MKIRLGDLLVQNNLINDEQLKTALSEQRQSGRKLGATLIALNMVTEDQLLELLSTHLNVPLIKIDDYRVDPEAVKLLPEIQARRYRALVLDDKGDKLLVGMSDPGDINAVDDLSNRLPKPIEIAVVSETQLFAAYENFYRKTEEIASFAQELAEEYDDSQDFELNMGVDGEQETAVAKLLQSIFEDAVMAKASDIHIEPEEKQLRIRQRVDGQLQETIIPERNIAAALVLRLKLMSGLDISEKRLPQDGRAQIKIKGRVIDVRVSTMPVQAGESVVMRLLDQSQGILTLAQTGMPPSIVKRYRKLLQRPHGMILVTGPTGSGKTTTLYGSLSELNKPQSKIITVEDPVEYRLPRINQVQVNHKIDLTFSQVLRTTLRQDPDIIMVGEMRDKETVEIGLRGALTGHLVLSTLHTNDSISSAIRLLDMGAPGYLVASSLRAIIAQRLVRRICDNCVVDEEVSSEAYFWLKTLNEDISDITFKKGKGCQKCNHSGYRGRVGVFELLEMTEAMMTALKNNDTSAFSEAARVSPDYKPLAHSALLYAKEGITSIDEVLKLVEMVGDAQDQEHTEHTVEDDVPALLVPQPERGPSTLKDSLGSDFSGSGLSLEDDS